ncbi:MAG TPA: hypothetical protein VF652_02155, partial [Allosphingosinicella sp.]
PLKAGLNLAATLYVSRQLATLRFGDTPPADAVHSRIGGTIRFSDGATLFDLTAPDSLGDLDLSPAGLPVQSVTGGALTLSRALDSSGKAIDTLRIAGSATLSGTACACVLDVPTIYSAALLLALTPPASATPTVASALTLAGPLTGSASALQPLFGALESDGIDRLEYRFAPAGRAIDLQLAIRLSATWSFAPTVAVEQARLELHIVRDPSATIDLSDFRVTGQVRAGGQSVALVATIPGAGDWTLALAAAPPVTLASLATLAGFDGAGSMAALPAPLRPAASVGLESITLYGQPGQAISLVHFEFVQTEDWSVGGVLTLSNARLVLGVDVAAGTAAGYLMSTLVLGSGARAVSFSANGPVPPAAGQPWTVQMDPGQTVSLPRISDVTSLFGGAAPPAPAGADQLSDLVIDGMLVRFDPASSPVLRQIALSAKQSGDWILIGPDTLVLSDVYGRFDYANAGSQLTVDAGGSLTVLGTRIDARFRRPTPSSNWTLLAQTGAPVPAAGIASFDSWMNPGAVGSYLGAAAPMAGPARMGAVELDFAAADGSLEAMTLAFSLDLGWTLLPGKLTIDSLSAVLTTAVPVSTGSWTGSLTGRLTVFGAPVRVVASKATPSSSWTFHGELAQIAPVDLAQSAGSLTDGSSFLLPADIADFGAFPSQVTIQSAEIDAVPDTGYFRFAGDASFTGWSFNLAGARLDILAVGGEILLPKTGDPIRARVTGSLAFAGANIGVFLQLGSTAAIDTVVAGIVSPDSISALSLSGAVDSVAGTGVWSGAPLPQGYTPPGLTSAGFYLNLSKGVLALYGRAGLGSGSAAYA